MELTQLFSLLLLQKKLTVKGWCGLFADVLEELVPAGGERGGD